MEIARRQFLHFAGLGAAFTPLLRPAIAQSYPARPVRIIVPYGPAGIADVLARLIAQRLSERLDKNFYIENIPGAGSNIGMGRAAKSSPDGYTLLMVSPNFVTNAALYERVPYDPYRDFEAVAVVATNTVALIVNPSLPVYTVSELVELIRSDPGKYNYASPGTGTTAHLVGQLFRLSLNLDLAHVPFNSLALAIGSVLAGHTPIAFGGLPVVVPHAREGKLRVLAITSKTRSQAAPEVPTMAEAGYPEIEGENWIALLVPAGTPAEIVPLLYREVANIVALPDVKQRLATLGLEPVSMTPEQSAAQIRAEIAKWGKVISQAGIRPQ